MIPETKLWRNVLGTALREWLYGKVDSRREAEKFLFEAEQDFSFVCGFAGMDPKRLRARLTELVARRPMLRQLPGPVHREKATRRRVSRGPTLVSQHLQRTRSGTAAGS